MKNSNNSLWGTGLKELGYSKITVGHFEKNIKAILSASMMI